MIWLTIPGDPIAKKRARFARKGRFVHVYSDQETEESKWIMQMREQLNKYRFESGFGPIFKGPVEIKIIFWVRRPKSHYGTGKNYGIVKASTPKFPTGKPDIDNYVKFAMDCLNHCSIWPDDSYVVGEATKKRYGSPRTEIEITEANDDRDIL